MGRHATLSVTVLLLTLQTAQLAAGRRLLDAEAGATATAAAAAEAAALALEPTTLPASAMPVDPAADVTPVGDVEMKIINGQDVTNSTDDFSFMVALFNAGRFFCGGVLLDNTTVLTAAHCVVDTQLVDAPDQLTVWILGEYYPAAQIFAHPGYSPDTIPADNADGTFEGSLHDMAAIKLGEAAPAGTPTVGMVAAGTELLAGQRLQVAGWGTTETGEVSNLLKYAIVGYFPPDVCPPDYADMICSGGTGQNTCNGDSGGPLLLRDPTTRTATVLGVTSHGPECAGVSSNASSYGYYTDMRDYLDVIATWQAGQQIEWDGTQATTAAPRSPSLDGSGSSGGGFGSGSGSGSGSYVPGPVDANGWGPVVTVDPSLTDPASSSALLEAIYCSIFQC